ncbi:MAG TPA: thioredoxin domain-containing protein, partial [Vicinamibacterales bacterium]|nr:thioredoxin domain-containing protein [Vicinamibacterales bacterium]
MRTSSASAFLILWLLPGCVSQPGAQVARSFETPPGATVFEAPLREALATAWAARPTDYTPRTRHLLEDGAPRYINRLFLESSPYLRQHAHNPLNWYPWGDEAFELARALGRPVLLSIGYSTCHWCHVMEEESFDDEEIARYLNENYIVIKVDREVRPDLDAIYMSAVQLFLQGRGGWPMTVWLTPDGEPFSGATYLPARDGDRGVA